MKSYCYKIVIAAVPLFALICITTAQAQVIAPLWTRTIASSDAGYDRAYDLVLDNSGNIYGAGYVTEKDGLEDVAIFSYDSDGNQNWYETWQILSDTQDIVFNLAWDGGDGLYMTGLTSLNGNDALILKYDTDGNYLWHDTFDDAEHMYDQYNRLSIGPDGNIYCVGFSQSSGAGNNILIAKYLPDGTREFARTYNDPINGNDFGTDIVADASGNIFVSGSIEEGNDTDVALLKFDSMGNYVWYRVIDGDGHNTDYGAGLYLASDNSLYFTGQIFQGLTDVDHVLGHVDADNVDFWSQVYGSPGAAPDFVPSWGGFFMLFGAGRKDLAVDDDENLYCALTVTETDSSTLFGLLKYDTEGNLIWQQRYDGDHQGADYVTSLAVTGDGRAYVIGTAEILSGDRDAFIVSYDYDGTVLDTDFFAGDAGKEDMALAVALDQDDTPVIVGSTESEDANNSPDILVIKYCQGCVIEGQCIGQGGISPDNTCLICDMLQNETGWSNLPDGTFCDDGLWCTGQDSCRQGTCEQGDSPCSPDQECSEVDDKCLDPSEDDDSNDDASTDDDSSSTDDDDDDDDGCCGC